MTDYPIKRSGKERRSGPIRREERRKGKVPVKVERRSGEDRRGAERRSGRDRRKS